jgi:type II secretory pathway pseudopilin PulG
MKRRQQGFTYLSLVILLAIMGLVGAAALKVDALLARAAAEQELLEAGAAFSAALDSYAAATPQGKPPQPPTLQDLLKDTRFPGVKRHLRKIFVDPISGKAEWGITYLGDKVGVIGVYSLSQAQPLKLANFDARFQNFENKTHYAEWKFVAKDQGGLERIIDTKLPAVTPPVPVAPAPAPGPAMAPEAAPEPPAEPAAPEPAEPPEEPEQP